MTSVDDIAYMMDWQKTSQDGVRAIQFDQRQLSGLSQEERGTIQVLQLAQKALHIDELSQQMQLTPERLSPMLLQLELKNIVQGLPGSKFKLVRG